MGLFDKLKAGLQKTHSKLVHEIKRVVTGSPKLTGASLEDLEAALLGADLGLATTRQIVTAVKKAYETQGGGGGDVFTVARGEVKIFTPLDSEMFASKGALAMLSDEENRKHFDQQTLACARPFLFGHVGSGVPVPQASAK